VQRRTSLSGGTGQYNINASTSPDDNGAAAISLRPFEGCDELGDVLIRDAAELADLDTA
jgi:hypothetical protein